MKYFNKPKKTYRDLIAVRKIFINSGSLEYSLEQIKKRLISAQKITSQLKIKEPYRKIIENSLFAPFEQSKKIADLYNIDFSV